MADGGWRMADGGWRMADEGALRAPTSVAWSSRGVLMRPRGLRSGACDQGLPRINATHQPAGRAASLASHLAAAGWFVALAVLVTYPLVTVLDTHITGLGPGDHLAFLWNDWWARDGGRALVSGPRLFATDRLFAPFGAPLILNTHTALESVASATVLGAVPVVRAHNLLVLAGLAANGFAAYGLAFMPSPGVSPRRLSRAPRSRPARS